MGGGSGVLRIFGILSGCRPDRFSKPVRSWLVPQHYNCNGAQTQISAYYPERGLSMKICES